MRKLCNYKGGITFFLSYIVLFIFLMEVSLRVIGYIYNSIRTPDIKVLKIYCFGDSFTFGDGASPKNSYPRQLERMLNNGSKIKFQVFNLGIPGANSSQVLKYLKKILYKYTKPDLIIVRVGANDCWNFADNNFPLILSKENIFSKLKHGALLNNSRIYKLAKNVIVNFNLRKNSDYIPFRREEDNPKYARMDSNKFKKLVEFNLTKIIELAQSKEIQIILQNYPGGDVYGPTTIANIAERFSVPMVDNFYAFSKKLKQVKRKDIFAPYWEYSHPNAMGYRIMAEEIYKVMTRQDFVNKKTEF